MNDLSAQDRKTVLEILANQLDASLDQLTDDAILMDDLGADSLDLVQITMTIEDRFHLTLPDDRTDQIKTVGDLQNLLSELMENSPG